MTNPVLEAKITDIHSWWEVPCIAHFCSLFRASFNLIDFDIEDLEEALLTDDASDSGNTLIQELIVRLLRGYYGNNSISTFNYQMFLRRLFRQKCREFQCDNPFDNDMDFQFLPMRTKVEILHMLCDFRLDADDVLDILKDLDSDSLRVHPLGFDANKSAYWYFYGTRLYREDYPKKKKEDDKKKRKGKKNKNKEEESEEEVELGSGSWHVVCFTESDWERLALNTEDATDKNEQTLHQIIQEDFLPEIPKLFQEKERLQRKRFLELHPRKSSRIENLKRRKEEEMQYLDKYKRAFGCDGSESEPDSEKSTKKAKNARFERWKNRNNHKEDVYDSENVNSDSESLQESVNSFGQKSGFIVGRGRQTNNSLSAATGEILIQSTEKNRSPEWFDTKLEDLHIGMQKVLTKLKEHEDSWPFLQPVDENEAPNYYKVVKSPMSLQKMEDKLDMGRYKSLAEFKHDFFLILANCKQYNGSQNEYTLMGENLEKVFHASVSHYIVLSNSSEGEDGIETNDFFEITSSLKKKKRKRRKRSCSQNTVEADKENERKLSSPDVASVEVETRAVENPLNIESRTGEQKPMKRGKGRPPKNASTFDALEQTLRDINKWLDDTPKYTDYCSASNSPPQLSLPKIHSIIEVPSIISEIPVNNVNNVPKTSTSAAVAPAVRAQKQKLDPNKKRSVKENNHKHLNKIKQGRRDIQRTIDRLQPGKSKGNLISTICKSQSSKTMLNDELSIITKIKESPSKTITASENTHRPKPMLSLGTVLSNDMINLDATSKKHTFSDNDSAPSDEDDPFSENDETAVLANAESQELQAENLALDKPYSEPFYFNNDERKAEEKISMDVSSKNDNSNEAVKSAASTTEKTDKPTPNLSAWFKAFGAPKSFLGAKRKNDSSTSNEQPAIPSPNGHEMKDAHSRPLTINADDDRYDLNEPPPPTPGRFFTYDEEKDSRPISSLPSPDMKPLKRQRKLSTGSSVSERSSFSQDPNDPNSPHPSIDESVYQSPQPYHQSPIHNTGALKVGFYQDAFPKCSSDKSNSCSPREPTNACSPQQSMFSPRDTVPSPRGPRDIIAASPLSSDPVASPRDPSCHLTVSSPRNMIASPRYASVSPRDSFVDSLHSPATYTKSPPMYSPNSSDHTQLPPRVPSPYKTFPASTHVDKSPFSIYPVKKRISAELEHTTRQQDDSETDKTRTLGEKSFEHYSTSSQPVLSSSSFPSSGDGASSIPISLSHHPHSHFMDSYSDNLILSTNPYFRKDMYVSNQPATSNVGPSTTHISPLFVQQAETAVGVYSSNERSQSHYVSARQAVPTVTSSYNRSGSVPLDFTATSASSSSPSPLSLTNRVAVENYGSQFHPSRFQVPHSEADVLNFSSKNVTQTPAVYVNQASNEVERLVPSPSTPYLQTAAPATVNPNSGPMHSVSENVYPQNMNDAKHNAAIANYRSSSGTVPYPALEYFNGGKTTPNYSAADLHYSDFAATNDKKQYYANEQSKNNVDPNYMMTANYNRRTGPNGMPSSSNARYNVASYHNRDCGLPQVAPSAELPTPTMPVAGATTVKNPRKSKKKKVITVQNTEPSEQPSPNVATSMFSHFLSGTQTGTPVSASSQELKHNELIASSAFNFGTPPTVVQKEYHQYFDNLRSPRYFGDSSNGGGDKATPSQTVNNASFQFLAQRSTPPFTLAAQAFMNANAGNPCPPAIYSPPYLQRPPDDLLRPMMLSQGFMSAHSGAYPHGYINMHDPINRSPWL